MLYKVGVTNQTKESSTTITTTSIKNNKKSILKVFYLVNSTLGALFLLGVASYYSITYTLIYVSIVLIVITYWFAGFTIGNMVHEFAGILMGGSVVFMILVFGLSFLSVVTSLGIFSLAIFIAFLLMVTFSIRGKGYKMTLQLEQRFSFLLSVWIIVIATFTFFDKII